MRLQKQIGWVGFLIFWVMVNTGNLRAQEANDFVGKWKVISVALTPDASQKERQFLTVFRAAFLNAIFEFKANRFFSLDAPDKEVAIPEGVWMYDAKRKYLDVSEKSPPETRSQLMGMTVKKTPAGFEFLVDETPLILTVKRLK